MLYFMLGQVPHVIPAEAGCPSGGIPSRQGLVFPVGIFRLHSASAGIAPNDTTHPTTRQPGRLAHKPGLPASSLWGTQPVTAECAARSRISRAGWVGGFVCSGQRMIRADHESRHPSRSLLHHDHRHGPRSGAVRVRVPGCEPPRTSVLVLLRPVDHSRVARFDTLINNL
jgi:hypothetical protein